MRRAKYPTDLTDAPWELIRPLLPKAKPGGRPRSVARREVLNGISSIVRGGVPWRMLPQDRPPWGTVHYYSWRWRRDGTRGAIRDALRTTVRRRDPRHKSPGAAIIDSPTVKTTEVGGPRGYDAGERVKGRERPLRVDTMGMLRAVVGHSAGLQDRDGAKRASAKLVGRFPRLKLIWADGADEAVVGRTKAVCGGVRELVREPEGLRTFRVLPRRWVVGRTFGWLNRCRRLSQDYERETGSSEAMIHLAMIHLMLKRLWRA